MPFVDIEKIINRSTTMEIEQKRTLRDAFQAHYEESLWRDLEGSIDTVAGANNPTWAQLGSGPFYAYSFGYTPQEDECWLTYHVPHDWVPNSDFHFHAHWTTNGTSTNTVKWEVSYTYAKGFNQEAFNTTGTTINLEEAASGTAYQHMVTESSALTGATITEPDGLLLVYLKRVSNGGSNNADTVYLLEADFHYKSNGLGTVSKAPNFYLP
jgi:hypothetical protein